MRPRRGMHHTTGSTSEDMFPGGGPWMVVQMTCLGNQTHRSACNEHARLQGAAPLLGGIPVGPASLEDSQADVWHVWQRAKGHGHAVWHVRCILWTLQHVPCVVYVQL